MLTITKDAREKVLEYLAAEEEKGLALRVAVKGRGPWGPEYEFGLVREDEKADDDLAIDQDGFLILIDKNSAPQLEHATFEYVDSENEAGFRVSAPSKIWEDERSQAVQNLIDQKINPAVAMHGGHVSLVEVKEQTVFVRLGGGCQGCGMANVTLKQGIETMIKDAFPEIQEIVDSTDHAGGENPYYASGTDGQSAI